VCAWELVTRVYSLGYMKCVFKRGAFSRIILKRVLFGILSKYQVKRGTIADSQNLKRVSFAFMPQLEMGLILKTRFLTWVPSLTPSDTGGEGGPGDGVGAGVSASSKAAYTEEIML
jgi:hypothetical protein